MRQLAEPSLFLFSSSSSLSRSLSLHQSAAWNSGTSPRSPSVHLLQPAAGGGRGSPSCGCSSCPEGSPAAEGIILPQQHGARGSKPKMFSVLTGERRFSFLPLSSSLAPAGSSVVLAAAAAEAAWAPLGGKRERWQVVMKRCACSPPAGGLSALPLPRPPLSRDSGDGRRTRSPGRRRRRWGTNLVKGRPRLDLGEGLAKK